MFSLSLAILPVFLLLMAGAVCQRFHFPLVGFWGGVDKLAYWVLFPALLFSKTSQIDFSNPMLSKYALILLLALVVTAGFVFLRFGYWVHRHRLVRLCCRREYALIPSLCWRWPAVCTGTRGWCLRRSVLLC